MWSDKERRQNAIDIMKSNIDRDSTGQKLTDSAKQAAAEFAADVWKGNMSNGAAAKIGIKHVTQHILKDSK